MKAVVQDRYGPPEVLRLEDLERPEPDDDEVLIKVHASTVTQTDTHARAAHPFFWRFIAGFRRPRRWRTLGVELAGEVEAVGAAVTQFKVGDRVFGTRWFGAHAEYICMKESAPLALMPDGMSFEEAAAVCDGASQGLDAVRTADIQEGQRIVIYGASGSLGTAAVQLAKNLGAHVTAVCSTRNVELVRSLGADVVVDYLHEDFTKNEQTYDAIIDAVGKYSIHWGRRSLKRGGIYVATDFGPYKLETIAWLFASRWVGGKRLKFANGRKNKQDVLLMKGLIEAGKYRPVIDRRYTMEQVVEAHRYVETWHKSGNVVLTLSDSSSPRQVEAQEVLAPLDLPRQDEPVPEIERLR
jgi:NADPH:quinone reductase-like Zn-dependent oxidoreductase